MGNDLVVRLYGLPSPEPYLRELAEKGITLRRPRDYEKSQVLRWVESNFNQGFRDECDLTFGHPVRTFIAIKDRHIIGFSCYETTHRNFAGPIGVLKEHRGRRGGNVAIALGLLTLQALAEMGYAYAILGGVSAFAPLCRRVFGAMDIAGSSPGIYTEPLLD
jgi:hypothetical protein